MTNKLNALGLVFSYMPNAAFLLDHKGCYMAVTAQYAELLQQPTHIFAGQAFTALPIGDSLLFQKVFDQLYSGIAETRFSIQHPTGTASVDFTCVAKPVVEDDAQVSGLVLSLMRSEEKYQTIFDNVQDVFYQTNAAGVVTEISPSIKRYSGYSRSEVIGKRASDFYFYPDDSKRIVELLQISKSVADFEVRLKTRNNQLRYASVNAHLTLDQDGQAGTAGTMRDVTARKLQENALKALITELQETNEQKNKLFSIIGHDLRNPIAGSLQLLELTTADFASTLPVELHFYLTKIKQELGNANDLLEELLTWAKTQFKAFTFNPVQTQDLSVLLQHCVEKVLPMGFNKGVSFTMEVEDHLRITADVSMLETIIRNLVSNAFKFTSKGERVTLSALKVEAGIQFSVNDNGIGMSEESLQLLFNKNLNYTTFGTAGEKGTGLGLSICQEFVARHGGDIWAESVVGEGTTFYFTIPQAG